MSQENPGTSSVNDPAAATPPAPPQPAAPPATPPPADPAPAPAAAGNNQSEVEARITKARLDEKNKAQKKIETLTTERDESVSKSQKQIDELNAKLAEQQAKLTEYEDANLSDAELKAKRESVQSEEILTLKAQVSEQKKLIDAVAEQGVQNEHKLEIRIYRERKLGSVDLLDPDAIPKDLESEEAVDAAITAQQEKEERLRAEVRQNLEQERNMDKRNNTAPPANTPLDPASAPAPSQVDQSQQLGHADLRGMSKDDMKERKRKRLEDARKSMTG